MGCSRYSIIVSLVLAACTHQPPSWPRPSSLVSCYVLSAEPWYVLGPGGLRRTVASAGYLPRGIKLGTARVRASVLQVGTLVPDTGDMRVVWRHVFPDSLVLEFVPAGDGLLMEGIRLELSVLGDSLAGMARSWSDEMSYQPVAPVTGHRVPCPVGA